MLKHEASASFQFAKAFVGSKRHCFRFENIMEDRGMAVISLPIFLPSIRVKKEIGFARALSNLKRALF